MILVAVTAPQRLRMDAAIMTTTGLPTRSMTTSDDYVNAALHPSAVVESSASFAGGKGGNVTSTGR